MAYADNNSLRERGAGIAGVVLVHAGLAALVIVGLSTTVTKEIFSGPLPSREYKVPPPPPPPVDEPQQKVEPKAPPVHVPPAPIPLPRQPSFVDTTTELPPLGDDVILKELPKVSGTPLPTPSPAFAPKAAVPRNDPARWIGDSDYRSRWVREELSGTARFTLDIGTDGRVTGCRITGSTGHAALDEATCALLSKRARFKPATDSKGAATGSTYSSAVRWQLPD